MLPQLHCCRHSHATPLRYEGHCRLRDCYGLPIVIVTGHTADIWPLASLPFRYATYLLLLRRFTPLFAAIVTLILPCHCRCYHFRRYLKNTIAAMLKPPRLRAAYADIRYATYAPVARPPYAITPWRYASMHAAMVTVTSFSRVNMPPHRHAASLIEGSRHANMRPYACRHAMGRYRTAPE